VIKILLTLNLLFAQENFICTFKATGDVPKLRFRGDTREQAMDRTVRLCLSIRTQQYVSARYSSPGTERLIVFLEDCVNNTHCIENNKMYNKEKGDTNE
jgi:hypothetical protein